MDRSGIRKHFVYTSLQKESPTMGHRGGSKLVVYYRCTMIVYQHQLSVIKTDTHEAVSISVSSFSFQMKSSLICVIHF